MALNETEISYLNDLVNSGRIAEFGYALYNMTGDRQGILLAQAATGSGAIGGAYWWMVNRSFLEASAEGKSIMENEALVGANDNQKNKTDYSIGWVA